MVEANLRWLQVESQKRQQSDLMQLEKKLLKATSDSSAQLKKLSCQEFACEADAVAAAERFEQNLPRHRLKNFTVVNHPTITSQANPKLEEQPLR